MSSARLFRASCVALVATAMSFAIRGDIMGDFESVFALSQDRGRMDCRRRVLGLRLLDPVRRSAVRRARHAHVGALAAAGHIGGTLLTIAAPNFAILFAATLVIGIANGLVEAFVNPLVATLLLEQTRPRVWSRFTPGFPAASSSAACCPTAFTQVGLGWQAKMLLMLVPSVGLCGDVRRPQFPPTESAAAGVSFAGMFREVGRPLFLVVWLCMWLTAATELGPGQWYANIFNEVTQSAHPRRHHPARLGERHHVC